MMITSCILQQATLPLGSISPIDARRQLETIRSDEVNSSDDEAEEKHEQGTSPTFALELAYIIEHYCDQSAEEAIAILDLFLEGADSVMLGVSFAQRHRQYSSVLWDKLINHCLLPRTVAPNISGSGDGILFGSLLEAAALSGADVARLVAKIPPGMVVEGLRPRLVAAVADYRLKVGIHQAASAAASQEQVALIREVSHRSRRGARFTFSIMNPSIGRSDNDQRSFKTKMEKESLEPCSALPKTLRPIERRDRHTLSLSLPLR